MKKPQRLIIAACLAMTLVGMLVVGSFLGALHSPKPHKVDVAVVGPADSLGHLLQSPFAQQEEGAFNFKPYQSEEDARSALLHRKIDGAIILGPTGQHLIFAGASGRFNGQILTTAFEAEAAASHQKLTVDDLRPLPSRDLNGISPLYFVFGVVLGSLAFGMVLTQAVGRKLSPATHLGIFAGFAVLIAAGTTWTVDGLVGALTHDPLRLFGIAALISIAVSSVTSLIARLLGPVGAGALGLLIVTVGMPAAGGPFGADFIPEWYSKLGKALPVGAGVPAVRNISYFGADDIGLPLTTLITWTVIGVLGLSILALKGRRSKGMHGGGSRSLPELTSGANAEAPSPEGGQQREEEPPATAARTLENERPAPRMPFGGPVTAED